MLNIIELQTPEDRKKYIDQFDPIRSTWIVSDLKSKFEIQEQLLDRYSFFEDESVLRASELWKVLLRRSAPDIKIVSADFIRAELKEKLKNESEVRIKQLDRGVFDSIQTFLPIYTHPNSNSFVEWLQNRPTILMRVLGWFQLGEKYYQHFIQKNILTPTWISGFLVHHENWEMYFQRNLVFDLGAEMTLVEQELIHRLSQHVNVQVLCPEADWIRGFSHIMRPYDVLKGKKNLPNQSLLSAVRYSGDKLEIKKMTGPLAEVKYLTEVVRGWVDSGVQTNHIGIVAPDIEKYWPLIQPYFLEEGIPIEKDTTFRLHSLPQFTTWLSRLRLFEDEFKYADLEGQCFQHVQKIDIRFERFEALFSQMLDSSDLSRLDIIEKTFRSEAPPSGSLSIHQFIGWVLKYWTWSEDRHLEIVIRELLTLSHQDLVLDYQSWVSYLESVLSKKEIVQTKGLRGGVSLLNIQNADSDQFKKRVFLGMAESQLKDKKKRLLSAVEIDQIAQDTGFYLSHPEQTTAEFELLWLLSRQGTEDHLLFPASSLQGDIETPHPFWVKLGGHQVETATNPEHCRWDEKATQVKLSQSILKDLGQDNFEKVPISDVPGLSASSLETYQNCPFQFFASRILALMDEPIVDLDLDQRKKGSLAHALFEKLTEAPIQYDKTEDEVRQILESIFKEGIIQLGDVRLWVPLREKHVKLGLRFLKSEKDWARQFPQSKVLGREKSFRLYYDCNEKKFTKSETPGAIRFAGQVDRVDGTADNKIILVDYKSSSSPSHSFSNWIKENRLQLGFYAMAFDMGLIEGFETAEVLGAHYYILKDMNREKGMSLIHGQNLLFPEVKKPISEEQKKSFYEELLQVFEKFVESIQRGDFEPRPRKDETCDQCRWRTLCRAPHLM